MALIDDVKQALRISASTTAFNTEVTDLIQAAKAELGLSGVLDDNILDTDALIKRAIITYCKANFGWDNPDALRLHQSFEMLRNHLTLSSDYSYFKVTFIVSDTATNPIREATVLFNNVSKKTSESGKAIFYVRAGNNYEYTISAEGYETDEDNLIDISSDETVTVSLVG